MFMFFANTKLLMNIMEKLSNKEFERFVMSLASNRLNYKYLILCDSVP